MQQDKSVTRRAFLWNTASGLINAGQSAIILVFISHFLTRTDAGIFTIAYALGNLFSTMGKYGVRNYQVTDVNENYPFSEYLTARVYTSIAALALMLVYLCVQFFKGAYSFEKAAIVTVICLWKMIDTIEDVYYGMYQQKGRLDIGAKCYTIRLTVSTLALCALVVLRVPMLTASMITMLVSLALAVLLVNLSIKPFGVRRVKASGPRVGQILRVCFPLFIGTSLSIYVGNSPKYLIDWYLDESAQAVFGYIMMPAFMIMVLNQFIYQPIIRGLGELWQSGDTRRFISRVLKQYLVVAGITVLAVVGGVIVGIPLLSILYNIDLAPYRMEFVVMLLGGGVYALVSFIMVPITAMRFQKCISYGFIAASVLSIVLGRWFIQSWGVMGAAILYLVLNTVLAVYLTACFLYGGRKQRV